MGRFFLDDEIRMLEETCKLDSDGLPMNGPDWLRGSKPLYIFGSGVSGRHHLRFLRMLVPEDRIRGFLDNDGDLTGGTLLGLTVYKPEYPATIGEKPLVFIASNFWDQRVEMSMQCSRLGYEMYPVSWIDMYFRTPRGLSPQFFEGNQACVSALDIWADAESRRIYQGLCRAWCTRDIHDLPTGKGSMAYFDPCVPFEQYSHFLDVGAHDGCVYQQLVRYTKNHFDRYYAWEANPDIHGTLMARVGHDDRSRIYTFAALDVSGTVEMEVMADYYAMGSCIRDKSDIAPQSISGYDKIESRKVTVEGAMIDAVMADEKVSLIKMDIEGAEPAALRGACDMLSKQRPALAISIYHSPSHLWEIPLWIHSLGLGYKLYCRQCNVTLNDSLCYALPA